MTQTSEVQQNVFIYLGIYIKKDETIKKKKSEVCKSIQAPDLILCETIFGCDNSTVFISFAYNFLTLFLAKKAPTQ